MVVSHLREGARSDTESDDRFTLAADQPAPQGGDSASIPFAVFLAGGSACTASYAQRYCRKWKLAHHGIRIELAPHFDAAAEPLA